MYAGKPILQSVIAGNDIPKEAKCGVTCTTDPNEIAETLIKMLNMSEDEFKDMGKNGRDYVKANSSYDVLAKKFIEVINK